VCVFHVAQSATCRPTTRCSRVAFHDRHHPPPSQRSAGGFLPTTASAQEEFVRQRLLVHTFDGPRGSLGRRVGDEISSAIDDGAKGRDLIVVDRDEMLRQLEKSGFNPDSVLLESEMRDMTRRYRADEYVIGRVVATNGTSVSLNGVLMLTRDSGLTPADHDGEPAGLQAAADAFAAEVIRARAQLIPVRRCENAIREGKIAEATAAALAAFGL